MSSDVHVDHQIDRHADAPTEAHHERLAENIARDHLLDGELVLDLEEGVRTNLATED